MTTMHERLMPSESIEPAREYPVPLSWLNLISEELSEVKVMELAVMYEAVDRAESDYAAETARLAYDEDVRVERETGVTPWKLMRARALVERNETLRQGGAEVPFDKFFKMP